MSKIIEVDFRTNKQKVQELKDNIKSKFQNVKGWCIKNKELVITATPIVFGGLVTIVKVIGRNANLRKQESIKNLYCYDRSLGHYWRLRRELSNKEWLEIDRRKRNGERLADILADFKVLK